MLILSFEACCTCKEAVSVYRNKCFISVYFCVDCQEPSVEDWQDSSSCSINFPVPCVQMALCSIGGEVETHQHVINYMSNCL